MGLAIVELVGFGVLLEAIFGHLSGVFLVNPFSLSGGEGAQRLPPRAHPISENSSLYLFRAVMCQLCGIFIDLYYYIIICLLRCDDNDDDDDGNGRLALDF